MFSNSILHNSQKNCLMLIAVFSIAFIVMILRRPDIITYAQPWAEDGTIWLSGIYNHGFWSTLLLPQNGYYQTISRLTYGFAILFGISKAALVSNLVAIAIRCALATFILSKRLSDIDLKYRITAVVYILLMPNLAEGYVNITNIHWYLSLYLLVTLLSNKPLSVAGKVHDYTLLVISGLSGPFIIFIAPCLLIKRIAEYGGFIRAIKKINLFDITFFLCCMIQIATILLAPDTARSSAPLGASIEVLIKIISFRIIGGTFFENSQIAFLPENKYLCLALFLIFLIPFISFIFKSGWKFKAALIFPVLLISFALAKPMISLTEPQWPILLTPGSGERYFFVTNFAFFCFCLYIISKTPRFNNVLILALLTFTAITVAPDFKIHENPNVGYQQDLVKFDNAKPGDKVSLRINPTGWTMILIKK